MQELDRVSFAPRGQCHGGRGCQRCPSSARWGATACIGGNGETNSAGRNIGQRQPRPPPAPTGGAGGEGCGGGWGAGGAAVRVERVALGDRAVVVDEAQGRNRLRGIAALPEVGVALAMRDGN